MLREIEGHKGVGIVRDSQFLRVREPIFLIVSSPSNLRHPLAAELLQLLVVEQLLATEPLVFSLAVEHHELLVPSLSMVPHSFDLPPQVLSLPRR